MLVQGRSLGVLAILPVTVQVSDKKQCKERRLSLGPLRRNKITMVKTGKVVKQHPAVAAGARGCLLTLDASENRKMGICALCRPFPSAFDPGPQTVGVVHIQMSLSSVSPFWKHAHSHTTLYALIPTHTHTRMFLNPIRLTARTEDHRKPHSNSDGER